MEIIIRVHPVLSREFESARNGPKRLARLIADSVRVISTFGPDITYAAIGPTPGSVEGSARSCHPMSARSIGPDRVVIEIDPADRPITARTVIKTPREQRPNRERRIRR